jgi:hypothetical protein
VTGVQTCALPIFHAIPPKVWDGLEILRFHKCAEKIYKYKNHVTNYEMFAIAEAIIDYKYRTDQRFYLYVNALSNKIHVSAEDFRKGCEIYLSQNPNALRELMTRIDLGSGGRQYKNHADAVNDFVKTKQAEYLPA